jgi:hypothetical protein
MPHPKQAKDVLHPKNTKEQEVTRIEHVTHHLINDDHQVDVMEGPVGCVRRGPDAWAYRCAVEATMRPGLLLALLSMGGSQVSR